MTTTLLALLVAFSAQDKKKIKVDDFESEPSGWTALKLDDSGIAEDGEAKVAVTREAGKARGGQGSLSYAYELAPNSVRVLALQRPLDLSGMKSIRLWVKASHTTAVIVGLTESGGASYQASAYCTAGQWQEILVNLDELQPDEPGKDGNGKLDLDDVGSLQVWDIGCFLVNLLGDLKGGRTLWIDDVGFSAEAAPATTGPASVTKVVPVFVVDTFESPVIRWAPLSLEFSDSPKFNLFDAPLAVDSIAPAGGGKQSLKFAYPRKATKVHGLLRSVEKNDLGKATALDLSLRTLVDGTFVLSLEEKDGSRYQKTVELKALDGWKALSLSFSEFTVADDSQDENGKLDADQVKQITLADLTSLLGGGEGENTLWIDQVRFVLSP